MAEAASRPRCRFLKIRDVVIETSLSRTTIYRLIAKGQFPAPIQVSTQRVAWPEHAVQAWMTQHLENTPS